jgi:hypothetical protein
MKMQRKSVWFIPLLVIAISLVSPSGTAHAQGPLANLRACLLTCEQNTPRCTLDRAICIGDCFLAFWSAVGQAAPPLAPPPGGILAESAAPICRLVGSSPSSITVGFQDTGSGLQSLQVVESVNVTVSIPSFSVGTTSQVLATANKNNVLLDSRVWFAAVDQCSNVTICDPILTTVLRDNGKSVAQSMAQIPWEEDTITVTNNHPGLRNLEVIVNGDKFKITGLADGEEHTLDISSAMIPGDNNLITFKATGKPGGSATVLIWEGVTAD